MFTRLIFASLLADFVLQPGALVAWKKESYRGLLLHGAIVLATSLLAGVGFWSMQYVRLVFLLSVVHVAIDEVKILADRRWRVGFWPLATFIVDQAFHLTSIVILALAFGYSSESVTRGILHALVGDSRYLGTASVYLAAVLGGSVMVRLVIQPFELEGADRPGLLKAGAYIGMVERLLIISLVALNQYGAVGFVLAAKSVARYKQIESVPEFAEYYLIGTLTSSAIGVAAGLLVKAIWN